MIVLDSSFLVAYHNTRDVHHPAAVKVMARFLDGTWGKGLLPEYVFLEVTTVLAARVGIEEAVKAGRVLLEARDLELVPCSELFLEAWDVFRGQSVWRLSFADAAIVAVARDRNTPLIATFDEGFRSVEGLEVVPP